MGKKQRSKRILGISVLLLAIAFFLWRLWLSRTEMYELDWGGLVLWAGLVGVVTYAFSCILLVFAWWRLLSICKIQADFASTYWVYARTQIAKYLPGNIFHFLGRQVLGKGLEWNHSAIAASTIFEIGWQVLSALTISILVLNKEQSVFSVTSSMFIIIMAVALPFLLYFAFQRLTILRQKFGELPVRSLYDWVVCIGPVYLAYLSFFLLVGSGLYVVAGLTQFLRGNDVLGLFVGSYALAWLAGYITPGAAAGIGVREAVMVSLLRPCLGEPQALAIALAFRFMTILGDGLFFLSAYMVPAKYRIKIH